MFRSTSSNTSIAAICGHPSLIERKRPSSHISTRSYNSQRSCESTHRQTNSGSSLRSLQSHTHSSASISSLSDAVGHHDSFRKTMNTSYSSSSNDDYSLTFDSGPGSPASLPLPQTPPSPPPYFQSLPLSHVKSSENDDWMSSVLRPSLMSLPADCTSVGNQPRRPRTSSTNSKRGQPLDSPQMQGVLSSYDQNFPDLSVSSASSSPHSAPEGTIILKVKHNAEIVMVKVARSAPLEEVKQAVVERFRSHNIRLDPAWLQLSKSNGPASRKPDRHRDVTPLQTDAAWLAASASAVKLTILC